MFNNTKVNFYHQLSEVIFFTCTIFINRRTWRFKQNFSSWREPSLLPIPLLVAPQRCWELLEKKEKNRGTEKEKGLQKAAAVLIRVHRNALRQFRHRLDINLSSELTGESGRAVSAREADADTSFSSDDGRRREKERERWSENGRRRGWLRECTKLFLSRGNRGVLCALRHRQAALCSVHAMRIDWPGPYESGYTTSGRRFRLLSSPHTPPLYSTYLVATIWHSLGGKICWGVGEYSRAGRERRCPF